MAIPLCKSSFNAKLRYCFGLTLVLSLLWVPGVVASQLDIPFTIITQAIVVVLMFIVGVGMIWIWGTIGRLADYSPAQLLIMNRYFKPRLEKAERGVNKTVKNIDRAISQTSSLKLLPPEFAFPQAIYRLEELLATRRADSLKEAMNTLDTEFHRKRMEMGQAEILQLQQETLYAAKQAQSSADTAAILSAFNLFK